MTQKSIIDSYGCCKCQVRHYEGDPLYNDHLKYQSKHGIQPFPNPYIEYEK